MEEVIKYKTFDNEIFDSQQQAKRHLDNLYANIICKVSHNIVVLRYKETAEYIDKNLTLFIELNNIKNDMKLNSNI